jgi:PAS domain S-box-containing protein
MGKFLLKIIVISLLLTFLPGLGATEEKTVLRIASFPFAPLIDKDSHSNAQGLNADLLNRIAANNSWQTDYLHGTWNEGLERARAGELDLLTAVMYTVERDRYLDYTQEPIVTVWGEVYALPKTDIDDIFALDGKKIALMQGDLSGHNFRKLAQDFGLRCDYVELGSHAEVFAWVEQERADAGVAPNIYGMTHISESQLARTSLVFSPNPLYFAAPAGTNSEVLNIIDRQLQRWKQNKDSFYYQSLDRWLSGPRPARGELPQWAIYIPVGAACIVVLMVFWNRSIARVVARRTAKLKASEAKFKILADHTFDWEYWLGTQREYLYISPSCERITGYKAEQFMTDAQLLYRIVAPEDRQKVIDHFENKDLEAEQRSMEFSLINRFGEERRIEHRCLPVYDEEGHFQGRRGTHRDITARQKAEKQRLELEKEVRQKHKLEAVGQLAGGIAHNFNNSLAIIIGNLDLALMRHPADSKVAAYLENARIGASRSVELVKKIVTYSRQGAPETAALHLGEMINEAIDLLQPTLPSSIDLHKDIAAEAESLRIRANTSQIQEILLNLCSNAAHAMDEEGQLTIMLKQATIHEQDIPAAYDCAPGAYAQISVRDNGSGIPDTLREKIFDPFFTTKEVGQGTGMGLATVQSTIVQYGGFITLDSTAGEGTTFHLFFPIAEDNPAAEEAPAPVAEGLPGGRERILFVDDEKMLTELAETLLRQAGYQVTIMTDSSEALKLFSANAERIDLLITDQTMPKLNGLELIREIKQIKPEIPALLCTGHSNKVNADNARQQGVDAFITKPFERAGLLRTVRLLLDGDRNRRSA